MVTLMELSRITDNVYYASHEQRRDRPILGYIHGERYSVMVDAGASAAYANDFYRDDYIDSVTIGGRAPRI